MWRWTCGVKPRSSYQKERRWVIEKFWNFTQKEIREREREPQDTWNENNKNSRKILLMKYQVKDFHNQIFFVSNETGSVTQISLISFIHSFIHCDCVSTGCYELL